MINYRRLKGSSVSEEFEKKANIYDGSIVNEYADVFLPPSDYSFSFHFYFRLITAPEKIRSKTSSWEIQSILSDNCVSDILR